MDKLVKNKMMLKICNYAAWLLTGMAAMAVLGLIGSYELGNISGIYFLSGLAICIAVLVLVAWLLSVIVKKENALQERQLRTRQQKIKPHKS